MLKTKAGLTFLTFCLVLMAMQFWAELFEYNRALIFQGQWWRLMTGHFTHSSFLHIFLNGWAAVLMALLFAPLYSLKHWLLLLFLLSFFVSLGLLFFCPQLDSYRGLSGVLHGVFMIGALSRLVEGERFYVIALAVLLAKMSQEWHYLFTANYYSAELDSVVVVEAHFLGLVLGIVGYGLSVLIPLIFRFRLQDEYSTRLCPLI